MAIPKLNNKGDLTGVLHPIVNTISNALGASSRVGEEVASLGNQLLGQRGRLQFSKHVAPSNAYQTNTTTDTILWRFACHTGPVTKTMRFTFSGTVATGTRAAGSAPFARWIANTGLTGAGTTTTGVKLTMYPVGASTNVPNIWWFATQDFVVTPDTDYTFVLHVANAAAVFAASAYELTRPSLTAGSDTLIDSSRIAFGLPITDTEVGEIVSVSDLIWTRGGHPIFCQNVDTAGGSYARTTATFANIIDQTLTGAPAAADPQYPCYVDFSGSLDSSNVACVFWAFGSISAGSGQLAFRDQANNTLATLTINSATPSWWSTTGNLTDASGGTKTTSIVPYFKGDGTHSLVLSDLGCFMKV